MKITDVTLFRVHGHYSGPTFPPGHRQARQIDLYPEFNTGTVNTLFKAVHRERRVLFASAFMMVLLVILTASLGYELEHAAQPDKFESIPASMYWAVITLASVGYGDISPTTTEGRFIAIALMLVGIGAGVLYFAAVATTTSFVPFLAIEALYAVVVTATFGGNLSPTRKRATSEQLLAYYQKRRGSAPEKVTPEHHTCGVGKAKCAVTAYGELLPCIEVREPLGNLLRHWEVAGPEAKVANHLH